MLRANWDENRLELVEQFKILMLGQKNNCLAISDIATGGMAACLADPKIIFATALKARAIGIILAHNHPSENLQASGADLTLTRKLVEGSKLLDINVVVQEIQYIHPHGAMLDQSSVRRHVLHTADKHEFKKHHRVYRRITCRAI